MSGKKSTEVADLLQQGWAARELTNNRLDDAIRKYAESVLKDNKELRENYIRRTTEIEKYQLKMEEEGFQLFSKYFHNLWD